MALEWEFKVELSENIPEAPHTYTGVGLTTSWISVVVRSLLCREIHPFVSAFLSGSQPQGREEPGVRSQRQTHSFLLCLTLTKFKHTHTHTEVHCVSVSVASPQEALVTISYSQQQRAECLCYEIDG